MRRSTRCVATNELPMPSLKVVLDTNVIVSAHLKEDGIERMILTLARAGHIRLFLSNAIFAEYQEVLLRPKFKLTASLVAESLDLIRSKARMVRPTTRVQAASDPDDNKFLECAEAAKADYLVTGNLRHFPKEWKGTQIVNSRQMIEVLV